MRLGRLALATLLRRLPHLLVVLAGVITITFAIAQLVPSDPARLIAGDQASDEIVAEIRARLGLDRPIVEQFARYVGRALTGDLGTSIRTGRPVIEDLATAFPATIELTLTSMLLVVLIAIPLGVKAARNKDATADRLVRLGSMTLLSVPSFWLGLMLIFFLYGQLGLFPAGGRIDPALADLPRVTGLYLVDGLLALRPATMLDALWHLALPALTLAAIQIGSIARLVRAAVLDVLNEDYMRTARAAGLSERTIARYALRNAMMPIVTTLGLLTAELLAGAVVTEIVFSWPGIGSYTVEAISALDFPAIMGFTIFVALIFIIANFLVDIAYLALDPRIRRN